MTASARSRADTASWCRERQDERLEEQVRTAVHGALNTMLSIWEFILRHVEILEGFHTTFYI